MTATKKAGPGSTNGKQSQMVADFIAATTGLAESAAAAPQVVFSGFVATSKETEAQKAAQQSWDRSELLKVRDDDAQVKIYERYQKGSNTNAEGGATKRGLGLGSEGGAALARRGGGMSFVSAGGAPAETAANAGRVATQPMAPVQPMAAPAALPAGWSSATDPHGTVYYVNPHGQTQWEPPPPPPPPAPAALPAGWTAATDPSSGRTYFTNAQTGATQWEPPAPQPPAPPPPPPAPAALPAGWTAATDPSNGRTYFTNAHTGATQWEPPASASLPVPSLVSPPLPAPSLVSPPSVGGTSAWAAAPAPSAAASVRVTGLPTEWTAGDVKEHFGSCGKIISVSDLRGGVGTISFDSEAEAAKAAQDMDGVKLRANKLSVMATAQANRAKPY
jgi:uncharacterized protein YbdZ (MbtH family)